MSAAVEPEARQSVLRVSGSRRLRHEFAHRIVEWQRRYGRHDLPWQESRDPYRIWVSEIMLQQTQVATVIPYFLQFIARFPDVQALAAASLDEVMRCWSGLGYYSRARNLHAAARAIAGIHAGSFPSDAQALAALPGIGRSTAAAIAALAYGARCAILDGNVRRVLCRVFAVVGDPSAAANQRELWTLAESLVPDSDTAAYTQGLMDLGATLCVRHAPKCGSCPVRCDCVAANTGRTAELPAPRARRNRPQRAVAMILLHHAERVWLEKRPAAGIWGGLWCFPEAEVDADPRLVCEQRLGAVAERIERLQPIDHGFTHFQLRIHPLRIEVSRLLPRVSDQAGVWLPLAEARGAAVPAPVRTLLEGF